MRCVCSIPTPTSPAERFAGGPCRACLERMRAAGVTGCVVVCDPGDLEPDHVRALEIVRQNPGFRLAAGVHPAQRPQLVGRAGKDAARAAGRFPSARCWARSGWTTTTTFPRAIRSARCLSGSWTLALELDMPVQLHIREAHGEAMELMRAPLQASGTPAARHHALLFRQLGNWPRSTSPWGIIYRSPAW